MLSAPRLTGRHVFPAVALAAWLTGCAGAQAQPVPPAAAAPPGVTAPPPADAASPAPGTAAVRVVVTRGVEYARAGDAPLLADLLRPDPPAGPSLPVIIYIHGGSWKRGSREQGHELLPQLVATGRYLGVTIDHRFIPASPWPAQLQDARAAVRWVRANAAAWGADPGRIAAWGESSGAQIAMVLGMTGDVLAMEGDLPLPAATPPPAAPLVSRVQAVVDFCGPPDMDAFHASASTPEDIERMRRRLEPLFGGPLADRRELVGSASAVRHISADDPPILLMHGERDEAVPFRLAEAMHAALRQAGVPGVLVPVAGWGHGFRGAEIDRRVLDFLDHTLWRRPIEVSSVPVRAERTPE